MKMIVSEDHALFRDGLCLLLRETFNDTQVLEADNFYATQALLKEHTDIDLLLLDIHMPGTSGLEGLKQIKKQYPILPLVVVSTVDQVASIRQMMDLGADGFISKTCSKEAMADGLRNIMLGEQVTLNGHDTRGDENCHLAALSTRQQQITQLLDKGLSNKAIAAQLNIGHLTVRDHISELSRVFQCENRTELAIKMRKLGYVFD